LRRLAPPLCFDTLHADLGETPVRSVCLALVTSFACLSSTGQSPRITGDVVPGAEWQQVAPESVGYSSAMLEALRAWVKTQQTTS